MKAMYEWALANEKDESDKPELSDQFVQVPGELSARITDAGGDITRIVKWFECDRRPVYRFPIHGSIAVAAWHELSAAHATKPEMSYWPIIVGPNEAVDAQRRLGGVRNTSHTAQTVKQSAEIDVDKWLEERLALVRCVPQRPRQPYTPRWPHPADVALRTEFTTPLSTFLKRPLRQVWIALLPIQRSWEAAAAMSFGKWNENPKPLYHVALHHRWQQLFGANLVAMTHDVLEFQVARPPTSRDVALALAENQYNYCPDIVEQGMESIEALALSLLNSNIWYFWWD